jgi:hypothetical protein
MQMFLSSKRFLTKIMYAFLISPMRVKHQFLSFSLHWSTSQFFMKTGIHVGNVHSLSNSCRNNPENSKRFAGLYINQPVVIY